jgi:hypothetical protein
MKIITIIVDNIKEIILKKTRPQINKSQRSKIELGEREGRWKDKSEEARDTSINLKRVAYFFCIIFL